MASIKNKIARSRLRRADRKAANKSLVGKAAPRVTKTSPSMVSLWMLARGMFDNVPKRFRPVR